MKSVSNQYSSKQTVKVDRLQKLISQGDVHKMTVDPPSAKIGVSVFSVDEISCYCPLSRKSIKCHISEKGLNALSFAIKLKI